MVRRDFGSSNDPPPDNCDGAGFDRDDWRALRASFSEVVAEWDALRQVLLDERANFNPAQLRISAGQDGAGQWTRGSVVVRRWTEDMSEDDASEQEPPKGDAGSAQLPPNLIGGGAPRSQLDYAAALTGIERIDTATKTLGERLCQAMELVDFVPQATPQAFGTAVHVAFGTLVRVSGIRGISPSDVETSFTGEGDPADYGVAGSIRTDVVLRNEAGDIMAIYDVKTGRAGLSAARIRELRLRTNTGPSVPIFEVNFRRNAILKKGADEVIGFVTITLYRD